MKLAVWHKLSAWGWRLSLRSDDGQRPVVFDIASGMTVELRGQLYV